MPSVVIIGAGVIGLSIGWQLARENLSVHILEQRYAGKQASWAAAGMLTPYWEAWSNNVDLLEIRKQSLAQYPRFLEELQEDSGSALPVENEGTLCVAVHRDDREWLHRQYTVQKKNGLPAQWLSGEEARQIEPLLSPRVSAGVWIPYERQMNNRLLIEALKGAFLSRGGILTENLKITELLHSSHETLHVQAESGQTYPAEILINTAGAWANQMHPPLVPEEADIRPVKGQILSLRMQPHLSLKHMIRTPRIYLVPKQEGIVRIGATSEDLGFNEDVTAGATLESLQNAWEVIPAISEYQMEEIMAGLRPVTVNHMPFIGGSSLKGVYYAIGHGHSGILLAPYTAYFLKQIIIREHLYASSI